MPETRITSAQIDQAIYPLNINRPTSFIKGVFCIVGSSFFSCHNLLLVEAMGIAPMSCPSFNPYHWIVLYLYHI